MTLAKSILAGGIAIMSVNDLEGKMVDDAVKLPSAETQPLSDGVFVYATEVFNLVQCRFGVALKPWYGCVVTEFPMSFQTI